MDENFIWDAYLLKRDLILKLWEEGKLLRTMLHESIVSLKLIGPVTVTASNHYKAKREFFRILSGQSWFRKTYSDFKFVNLLPYIYVKNRVDSRYHPKPDWEEFAKVAGKRKISAGVVQ